MNRFDNGWTPTGTTNIPPPPKPRSTHTTAKGFIIAGLVFIALGIIGGIAEKPIPSPPAAAASATPGKEPPANEQQQLAKDWVLGKPLSKEKQREVEEALELPRVLYAKNLENHLLDGGYNVDVTTSGVRHTTLHVKWVLASKVDAYKLTKSDDFLPNLKQLGFKKFILDDGYEQNWTWDLAKY